MSNRGKFVDHIPFIKTVGVTTAVEGDNTDQCIRQDVFYKVNIYIKKSPVPQLQKK